MGHLYSEEHDAPYFVHRLSRKTSWVKDSEDAAKEHVRSDGGHGGRGAGGRRPAAMTVSGLGDSAGPTCTVAEGNTKT